MHFDPKTVGMVVILVALAAVNLPGVWAWAVAWVKAGREARVAIPDRTPGEVLDCLISDMRFLREHTDAPPELLTAVEALTPYLMHAKGSP